MSATIGHNNPPVPTLPELLSPATIDMIIAAELDREPEAPEGGKLQSIRARDTALADMCQRFLAAHPEINSPDVEATATSVLSTVAKFTGGSGRIETARKALKEPVLAAGRAIDAAFAKYGLQLLLRPLTGPAKDRRAAPFTLAEQIAMRLAAYKDECDRVAREAAAKEAKRLADEAAMATRLAARGSATVTMDDAATAAEGAEKMQAVANAPAAALTRSHGGDFGTASRRRIRTFVITNPALVPRQYCAPVDALIRAAIGQADGPMPTIPGIEIRDETALNVR